MLILDASMALAWIFARSLKTERDCADRALHTMQSATAQVPVIWHTEVFNGLLLGERRQIITETQSADYLRHLDQLTIVPDFATGTMHRDALLLLARKYSLTAYDACYLELTLRLAATLATFDRKLASATLTAGGDVFV